MSRVLASHRISTNIGGNVTYMLCCLTRFGGQLWYGIRNKTWSFTGTMCADVLGEAVGYVDRIMFNLDPFSMNVFFVYVTPSVYDVHV